MNVLFLSDLHLPLGPREPIRPEMRKNLRPLAFVGELLANWIENRLRWEADRVMKAAARCIRSHEAEFDLIINGGDNALPLSKHTDRMMAIEMVWREQLARYGEDRLIVCTGNHELGHGFESDPGSYPDLQNLRKSLFNDPLNINGFGHRLLEGVRLLVIDSELVMLGRRYPAAPGINLPYREMSSMVLEALNMEDPLLIVTHNTERVRRWFRRLDYSRHLTKYTRRVVMLGGHFHMPRKLRKNGVDIFWSGGGSYPEPWLRWTAGFPGTGFMKNGPGSITVKIKGDRMKVRHQSFGFSPKSLEFKCRMTH